MADLTSPYYLEGDYIALMIIIPSPYEGTNEASLNSSTALVENSWDDYFDTGGLTNYGYSSESGFTYYYNGDTETSVLYGAGQTVNIEIASLGAPWEYSNTAGESSCEERVQGSLSTILYAIDPGSDGNSSSVSQDDIYSIPVTVEISFSIPRMS